MEYTLVQSGCHHCSAFLKRRRQFLRRETGAAISWLFGLVILLLGIMVVALSSGIGLGMMVGGGVLVLVSFDIAPRGEGKGHLSFGILGPHTHLYPPSAQLYLELLVGSELMEVPVRGPGNSTDRWKAKVDFKNRRIDFIDSEGGRVPFFPFNYDGPLSVGIPAIVQESYSVRDRFYEDRRRLEACRRLYQAAAATRLFMEETRALKRSEPLRQASELLVRGMMQADVPDASEWEDGVPAKLAAWRKELGLKYGPRPGDQEESA